MALVRQTNLVIYRFLDDDNKISTAEVNVSSSINMAAVINFAAALSGRIADLLDSVMLGWDVTARWVEVDSPAIAPTSDTERAGVFVFRTTDIPEDRYVISLPSLRNDLLMTTGDYAGVAIDVEQPEVAAFVAAMLDGIDGVKPRAPWQLWAAIGGGGGSWGGGGGGGGGWGDAQGGGGPWGIGGGGGGGSWGDGPNDDFYQGESPSLIELRAAYKGRSDGKSDLSLR